MKNSIIKKAAYSIFSVLVLSACSDNNTTDKDNRMNSAESDKNLHEEVENSKLSKAMLSRGGVYFFGEDVETGSVGSVHIYPLTDHSALFFLDVSRGAPSYNMGQLFGEMEIKNNKGVYYTEGDESSCSLIFDFNDGKLKVTSEEVEGGCEFGYGVLADNTYKKEITSIPKFFVNGEGDTIPFKGLTISKYEHRND